MINFKDELDLPNHVGFKYSLSWKVKVYNTEESTRNESIIKIRTAYEKIWLN